MVGYSVDRFVRCIAILSRSNNNQVFRFDDKTAYTHSANTIFYRLKLFDSNQEFSYKIEKVLLRNNLYAFSIAPNPVRDIIQVRYTTRLDQRTILCVFNGGGKSIHTSYQLPTAFISSQLMFQIFQKECII